MSKEQPQNRPERKGGMEYFRRDIADMKSDIAKIETVIKNYPQPSPDIQLKIYETSGEYRLEDIISEFIEGPRKYFHDMVTENNDLYNQLSDDERQDFQNAFSKYDQLEEEARQKINSGAHDGDSLVDFLAAELVKKPKKIE